MINLIMTNWRIEDKLPYINLGSSGENNASTVIITVDALIENAKYYLDIGDESGEGLPNTQELTPSTNVGTNGETIYTLSMKPLITWLGKEGIKLLQIRCVYTENNEPIYKESNVFHGKVDRNSGFVYKYDIAIFEEYLRKIKESLISDYVTQEQLEQELTDYIKDVSIDKSTGNNSVILNDITHNTANGYCSYAQNDNTIAQGKDQTVLGKFNIAQGTTNSIQSTDHALIIGNGTDNNNRSNALAVQWDGTIIFQDGSSLKSANDKQNILQFTTMPIASINYKDRIIQYVGDNGNYTNGYWYKCIENNGVYSWINIVVDNLSYVTPEMFGAVGDGVTDDTIAIQTALATGKTVKLDSKTYVTNSTLTLNNKQTIQGEGKQSIILLTGTDSIGIHIPTNVSYCEIKHLVITSSTYSGSFGIHIDNYDAASNVYDSSHIIEDVIVNKINGTGIYIGNRQRGCRLTNIIVSNCKGHGIYVYGTDNALNNISVSNCTKHGIYLQQNNRLYSAKAFVCGTDRSAEYFSLVLAANYNNVVCYDLQQSTYDGIYIAGSGNNISFVSDGVGYNNTDYDAHVSVLVFGNGANSNRIVGTVTQGTLHGMFNHLVKTKGLCQNNHIDLTYQSIIYYPKDVYKVEGVLSPDNYYHVNNEDKNIGWQYVQVNKNNFNVIYKDKTSGQATTKSTTTGSIEIDSLYMPLAQGSGTGITFNDINAIISNGNYSYCYAEIKLKTNFPVLPQCRLNPALFAIFPDGSINIQPSGVHFINSDYVYSDMKCICSKLDNYTPYALRFVIRNNSTESIPSSEFGVDNITIEVEDIKFAYI